MSDYNLLTEEDKDELEMLANQLLSNAEFCEIYESDAFCDRDEEAQAQAFNYLLCEISASRDDK